MEPLITGTRATIGDVARHAGVSKMTVSRVINGSTLVAGDTAQRVEAAIRDLGFVVNVSARRLASRKARAIVLESPDYDPGSGWGMEMYYGVAARAAARGYEVVVYPRSMGEADAPAQLQRLVTTGRADGLILFPFLKPHLAILDGLRNARIPFVALHPPTDDPSIPHVTVTDRRGAFEMTQYLIGFGHRQIGLIGGPPFLRASLERLEGYREALGAEGIAVDSSLVFETDMRFQSGVVIGRSILRRNPRPTAIFAITDELAAGVIQAAHQMGLSIPDDVSIVGFDDSPLARKLSPPLTTMRQPTSDLAAEATDFLIDCIEGELDEDELSFRKELPTNLVIRESVGAPRAR